MFLRITGWGLDGVVFLLCCFCMGFIALLEGFAFEYY